VTFDPDFKVTTFFDIDYLKNDSYYMERQQEVIRAQSHGDIFNDLDGLLTQFLRSQHF